MEGEAGEQGVDLQGRLLGILMDGLEWSVETVFSRPVVDYCVCAVVDYLS